jgi:hypothetical protein
MMAQFAEHSTPASLTSASHGAAARGPLYFWVGDMIRSDIDRRLLNQITACPAAISLM